MSASDGELGEKPTPTTDPAPEPGPGGPADRVEHDPGPGEVTVGADQPRSAQVEDEAVPDEIEEPEQTDEGEKDVDPGDESPA